MRHSVDEVRLSNGAKGLIIDAPDAHVVHFEFNFRAGYYLVGDKLKWEVPHIMEHMVGANPDFPSSRSFDAELEKNGAYYNASTNSYNITYMLECADFEWERVMSLMLKALENPLFTDKELKAEKGNVKDELTGDLNNNFRQLVLAARERQGMLVMPDAQRIPALESTTVEDIEHHFKKTHLTDNLRFVIAGNLKDRKSAIIKRLEALDLSRGKRFDLPDESPIPQEQVVYVDKKGVDNAYFILDTYANRRLERQEEYALNLLNTMLTATLHSRILGTARERGLVYGMSSHYNQLKDSSDWWFGAQIRKENAPALFELIREELSLVLQGKIDDADIEAAKLYSLGKHQRGIQTVAGLLRRYSHEYYFNEGIEDYFAIPENIKAVTKQNIIDVARVMFNDSNWGLSVLGYESEDFAKDLRHRIAPLWQ